MEAIGGFGANLAGQILAKAAVLGAGFYGVNFSSYGTEKRGTPVRSFIRLAENNTEIFDHSPVESPMSSRSSMNPYTKPFR
ncbi:MAG: 2-oxoacid:acceptor oxidoreductase family protein [Caldibacillus sp.]